MPPDRRTTPGMLAQQRLAAFEAGAEAGRQLQALAIESRHPQAGQVGDDVQVLAVEQVAGVQHRAKTPAQVIQAEVVDVLVEQVEPGAVLENPVQARHFDVDQPPG